MKGCIMNTELDVISSKACGAMVLSAVYSPNCVLLEENGGVTVAKELKTRMQEECYGGGDCVVIASG